MNEIFVLSEIAVKLERRLILNFTGIWGEQDLWREVFGKIRALIVSLRNCGWADVDFRLGIGFLRKKCPRLIELVSKRVHLKSVSHVSLNTNNGMVSLEIFFKKGSFVRRLNFNPLKLSFPANGLRTFHIESFSSVLEIIQEMLNLRKIIFEEFARFFGIFGIINNEGSV